MDQTIIKVILIVVFLFFGLALILPGGTARAQAIRTLLLIVFVAAAIVVVLVPSLIDDLARSVGVGRGTDLLLYAFIIVFVGNALSTTRKRRMQDTQLTEIARQIALAAPQRPEK